MSDGDMKGVDCLYWLGNKKNIYSFGKKNPPTPNLPSPYFSTRRDHAAGTTVAHGSRISKIFAGCTMTEAHTRPLAHVKK